MELLVLLLILMALLWVFRKTLKIIAKASEATTETFALEVLAQAVKRKAKIHISDDDMAKAMEVDQKLEKLGIDL